MIKQFNLKWFYGLTVLTLILGLGVYFLLNPESDVAYFERFHFDKWSMVYPESEPLTLFRDEAAFRGDRYDYIIYAFDKQVESVAFSYINTHSDLLERDSKNESVHYDFFADLSAPSAIGLSERIQGYDYFEYWFYQKDSRNRMMIVISQSEIIFAFDVK